MIIILLFQGMLGCDLVGFHIEDYCLNFLDCCQRYVFKFSDHGYLSFVLLTINRYSYRVRDVFFKVII